MLWWCPGQGGCRSPAPPSKYTRITRPPAPALRGPAPAPQAPAPAGGEVGSGIFAGGCGGGGRPLAPGTCTKQIDKSYSICPGVQGGVCEHADVFPAGVVGDLLGLDHVRPRGYSPPRLRRRAPPRRRRSRGGGPGSSSGSRRARSSGQEERRRR